MDRAEAQEIVNGVTKMVGQYKSVSAVDARRILGEAQFTRMMNDSVRRLGPTAGTVYPWNVVDYLQMKHTG